jgi:hypothetical protein
MNKWIVLMVSLITTGYVYSQESQENIDVTLEKVNEYTYELGNGILFNFDDSTHIFQIGGMIQPRFLHSRIEDSTMSATNYFGVKRSYFSLNGKLNNGMFSFLIQSNFSESYSLLDAWAGYHPNKNLSIYFGQRMSPCNNISMQFMEYDLQFASRNYLSHNFTETGREFGMFIESKLLLGSIGIKPIVAITSGDGKNSFGVLSNDTDKGGMKYGGRLNVYPLGFFSDNNEYVGHDVVREQKPKIMIGAATSLNVGASHAVGEGHYMEDNSIQGAFMFLDSNGVNKLPNYLKNYVDVMFKYKGFNFLVEYVNTAAYNLQVTPLYADGSLLKPKEISEYLILGNAFNFQGGFLFKGGWSLDAKYGRSYYEFDNPNSLLRNYDSMGGGITKYFSNKAVKTQLMATYINFPDYSTQNQINIECLLQIKF